MVQHLVQNEAVETNFKKCFLCSMAVEQQIFTFKRIVHYLSKQKICVYTIAVFFALKHKIPQNTLHYST